MIDKDFVNDAKTYYKEHKAIARTLLIIFILCVLEIFGLSIWLGFPSPHFNRLAITIVGYIVSVVLGLGSMLCFIIVESNLSECATYIVKAVCK